MSIRSLAVSNGKHDRRTYLKDLLSYSQSLTTWKYSTISIIFLKIVTLKNIARILDFSNLVLDISGRSPIQNSEEP